MKKCDDCLIMDKMVKVNIYLLRKCYDELVLKFNIDSHNPLEFIKVFDLIADEMNKEMPDLWYKYMACCGGAEE